LFVENIALFSTEIFLLVIIFWSDLKLFEKENSSSELLEQSDPFELFFELSLLQVFIIKVINLVNLAKEIILFELGAIEGINIVTGFLLPLEFIGIHCAAIFLNA
jgi:hypothetical protein